MQKNENKKPKVRFKNYTDEWKTYKLKEFGIVTGGTSIESEFMENGKYRVISIGSYSEQSTYHDQEIRCKLSERTKNRILNKNDLTMILNDKTAVGRIIGRVLLIDKNDFYVFNQRTERIEPYHDKFDATFLYELLNAPQMREKVFAQSQGNTQIYVNWSTIQELEYLIPGREEQRKIGQYFKKVDYLIELQQKKHEKLINIKTILLKKMFPNGEKIVPEIRFKQFIKPWKSCQLSEIGEIITGATPSTAIPEYYCEEGMPWVTPTDISQNITYQSEKTLSKKGQEVARIVPKNSILVTCIASIGKNTILGTKGSFNQQINAIVPDLEKYDSYFLLTESNLWSDKMKQSADAGTIQIVNKNEFSEIRTKVPELEEQKAIGDFFRKLDQLILHQQNKIEKLKGIKEACLDKMLINL